MLLSLLKYQKFTFLIWLSPNLFFSVMSEIYTLTERQLVNISLIVCQVFLHGVCDLVPLNYAYNLLT